MEAPPDIVFYMRSIGGGGAERVAVNLANQITLQGVKCHFVMMFDEKGYQAELHPDIGMTCLGTRRYAVAGMRLARVLKRMKPKVIFSTNQRTSFWAVVAKRLANTPTRIIAREPTTPSMNLKELPSPVARYRLKWMMSRSYRLADAVVAPSRGVRDDIISTLGITPSKVSVIYNPVITPQIECMKQEPVEHPWYISKTAPVILAVGRLVYPKNYPLLLRAFARVRKQMPARLMILGQGEMRSELELLASELSVAEDVCFYGFDPNPFRFMARSDVLVLSSVREGFPNVLVQAMACGCSVVSTDCLSGPREILDGGRYGALVPVGDEPKLAEAILRTLEGDRKVVPQDWLDQFRAEYISQQYLKLFISTDEKLKSLSVG